MSHYRDCDIASSTSLLLLLVCGIVLICCCSARADNSAPDKDGKIVKTSPCEAVKSNYRDWVAFQQKGHAEEAKSAKEFGVTIPSLEAIRSKMLSSSEYDRSLNDPRFQCVRMQYLSDGLKVIGYIFKPRRITSRRLPLIIYNRGGHADFDEVGTITLLQIHPLLEFGFIVLAPQYRGSDGGQGQDEFGGAEVHDVLNLVPLAESLGYVDMGNVFMYGVSRGGMETYLAIKHHVRVNAAAVLGAPADEVAGNRRRPMTDVYKKLVPGFEKDPETKFRERSAVFWADELNVPILILHGGEDWRVSPNDSLKLASRLQELNKAYQLFVYSGDDHDLSLHRQQRDQQIILWFEQHRKRE